MCHDVDLYIDRGFTHAPCPHNHAPGCTQVSPPTEGACRSDKLVVYGQNINSGIPHLCGMNTGQHGVWGGGRGRGEVVLGYAGMGDRLWRIGDVEVEYEVIWTDSIHIQNPQTAGGYNGSHSRNRLPRFGGSECRLNLSDYVTLSCRRKKLTCTVQRVK